MKKEEIVKVLPSLIIAVGILMGTYVCLQANDINHKDIQIEQMIQQRIRSEDGIYTKDLVEIQESEDKTNKLGILLPAVGKFDEDYIIIAENNNYKFYANVQNTVDQIVTVKNTGKEDVYVRTIFAFEAPMDHVRLLINDAQVNDEPGNDDWIWTWIDGPVEIDGVEYILAVATSQNVLEADETTIPSLLQVVLEPVTDNEELASYGDTYEILTCSQAVGTAGFTISIENTLNEFLGEITAQHHPWVE